MIEVQNDTYRRNSNGEFETFNVENNILTKKTESKVEVGIINKITSKELTISWKNGSNYTRYYIFKYLISIWKN